MTERNLGESFSWWIGEVINVKDPYESGRVQVRVYGRHDDKTNIPPEDLPWALPLQPVTSAASVKVGTAPVGLLVGSKVIGFWADRDQQYPIILGSFGKAGDPKEGSTDGGQVEIEWEKGSIPNAAQASETHDYNPYAKIGLSNEQYRKDMHTVITSTNAEDPETRNALLRLSAAKNTDGSNVTKDVEKKMKEPKKATTAGEDKNSTNDVLNVVKSQDPSNASAVLKNMVPNYMTVRDIMSLTSPAGLQSMLTGALTGALTGLASQLGLGSLMGTLKGVLGTGLLSSAASMALQGAMSQVFRAAAQNGGTVPSVVVPIANAITSTSARPLASLVVSQVPNFYAQQYYSPELDPYPGYIQWKHTKNGDYVYTLRNGQPNFSSAQQHIQYSQGQSMTKQMQGLLAGAGISAGVSVVNNLTGGAVTGAINAVTNLASSALSALAGGIDKMLGGALSAIKDLGLQAVLGMGVSMGSVLSLVNQLLPGGLSSAINGLMKGQLPLSVLGGAIAGKMAGFAINQALLALKKMALKTALEKSESDAADELDEAENEYQQSTSGGSGGSAVPTPPVRPSSLDTNEPYDALVDSRQNSLNGSGITNETAFGGQTDLSTGALPDSVSLFDSSVGTVNQQSLDELNASGTNYTSPDGTSFASGDMGSVPESATSIAQGETIRQVSGSVNSATDLSRDLIVNNPGSNTLFGPYG